MSSFVTKSRIVVASLTIASLLPSSAVLAQEQRHGYGGNGGHGECMQDVTPPFGGFKISVDDEVDGNVVVRAEGGDAVSAAISESASFDDSATFTSSEGNWMKWRLRNSDEGWKKIFIRFFNKCGLPSHVIPFVFYHFHHHHQYGPWLSNDDSDSDNDRRQFLNTLFGRLINGQWYHG